jgi:hypothetical protein
MAIFTNEPRGFAANFSKASTQAVPDTLGKYLSEKEQKEKIEAENKTAKKYKLDLKGISNPKIREELFSQAAKNKIESPADKKNYNTIKDAFGEKFAKVYKAAPKGGQTELLRAGIDARLRGQDVKALFDQLPEEAIPKTPQGEKEPAKAKMEFPEYTLDVEGKTPKEKAKYNEDLRKENSPLFQDASTKTKSFKNEKDSINILQELSDQIPDDISRFLINPKTGQPREWAQLAGIPSPTIQRFVKTVNDFTTKAKDTYGSRVTNFDLQQFMARLPSLMNTKEGRRQILRQMEIINELNYLHNNTLKSVYKNYGLGKITQEDALGITENLIEDQEEQLRNEFSKISSQRDKISDFNPIEFKGRKLRNPDTGEILISDGEKWQPLNEQTGEEI